MYILFETVTVIKKQALQSGKIVNYVNNRLDADLPRIVAKNKNTHRAVQTVDGFNLWLIVLPLPRLGQRLLFFMDMFCFVSWSSWPQILLHACWTKWHTFFFSVERKRSKGRLQRKLHPPASSSLQFNSRCSCCNTDLSDVTRGFITS